MAKRDPFRGSQTFTDFNNSQAKQHKIQLMAPISSIKVSIPMFV